MPFTDKPLDTRPASLVIRFSTDDSYQKAVIHYTSILGSPASISSPSQGPSTSFQVGSDPKPKGKDIELRLELHVGDTTALKDRTIIYWEIKPRNSKAAIEEVKTRLQILGYTYKESATHSLREERSFVMSDDNGNLFGGHPNPPFPPGKSVDIPFLGPVGLGAAGLLAGVLLTWLFVVRPLAARNAELESRR